MGVVEDSEGFVEDGGGDGGWVAEAGAFDGCALEDHGVEDVGGVVDVVVREGACSDGFIEEGYGAFLVAEAGVDAGVEAVEESGEDGAAADGGRRQD